MIKNALRKVFEASEIENRRVILEAVKQRAPLPSMLDLGCYDGAFTSELARAARASTVCGVEFLEEHAAKARARGVEVRLANLNESIPFEDARFDLVHANQVIEHLAGTDRFLAEARRVAKPGGIILLSTNNLASLHNIGSLVMGWQPFPAHVSDQTHVGNPLNPRQGRRHEDAGQTHLRIFTGRALKELAEHHGLATLSMGVSGFYPLPPRVGRLVARIDGRHAAFLVAVFQRPLI